MKILHLVSALTAVLALSQISFAEVRVACVGDSITAGSTLNDRVKEACPARLRELLGKEFDVRNFGIGGRTALFQGDLPYVAEKIFKDAKDFEPNIVIIKLGTNDSKAKNWEFKDSFKRDLSDIVDQFRNLPSAPTVYLCMPIYCIRVKKGSCNEKRIAEEIMPLIAEIAKEKGLKLIDLHPLFVEKPEFYSPDMLHPNKDGAKVMADFIFEFLKKNDPTCAKIFSQSAGK